MRKAMVFMAGLCFTSCGSKSSPPADVKDISFPGEVGKSNILAWYENDEVVVGSCLDGKPLVRSNCQQILNRKSFAEVVGIVGNNITDEIAAATRLRDEELMRLRNLDPKVKTFRQEIALLEKQISEQNSAIEATKKNIDRSHEELKGWNHQIEQTEQQISEVTRRIAVDPSNQELIRLRDQLNAERTRYIAGRDATQTTIYELNIALQKGQTNLKAYTTQVQLKSAELSHALATLPETSQDLERYNLRINGIMAERSRQQTIFSELRDAALVYRTSTMTDTDSQVVKRIFFNMGPSTTFSSNGVSQSHLFDGALRSGSVLVAVIDESDGIAEVACRQAGFLGDASFLKIKLSKLSASEDMYLVVSCVGTEKNLSQCDKRIVERSTDAITDAIRVRCNII